MRVLRSALQRAPDSPLAPVQRRQLAPTKCWSVVGDGTGTSHNLRPLATPVGWQLVNLKGWQRGKTMHGMVKSVYKFAYVAHSPGARIEFEGIRCTEGEVLRVFHLAGTTTSMGRARIEINGMPAMTTAGARHMSGYMRGQGALFISTDFVIPSTAADAVADAGAGKSLRRLWPRLRSAWQRTSSSAVARIRSTVAVISLNESDHPSGRQYGFALNAMVCRPP